MTKYLVFLFIASGFCIGQTWCERQLSPKGKMRILKVGYPADWGSLVPALQHTAYADQILANEFETLVREGPGGSISPGLANSWEVSDDFTKYVFHLDTSRRFSDGQKLNASLVKAAWEYGLALPSKSANSSLQDVLYLVEGYSEFIKLKSLPGLKVIDEATFEVRFKSPFRTAISEFATSRMAIFVARGRSVIGTGPYIIKDHEGHREAKLVRNPFYIGAVPFESVEISVVDPENIQNALGVGQVDLYAFADRGNLSCMKAEKISCWAGVESGHIVVLVNGIGGRTFESNKLRMALQYLMLSNLNSNILPSNYKQNMVLDPQSYLELQQGRLNGEKVQQIIGEGKPFVAELIRASDLRPLYLVTSEMNNWVQVLLTKVGVKFDKRSGIVDIKSRLEMYYKTFEPDLIVSGTSVSSGDPDGLFHVLARDGAITSPMIYRQKVSERLEQGRALLRFEQLDSHYKGVSEAILSEVPFVHIGFVKATFAFNSGSVKVKDKIPGRDLNLFTVFEPK